MEPITIVIPLRVDSLERAANLHCVLQYLLQTPSVYVDILEADEKRHFFFSGHERIRYSFVCDCIPIFYRTRYLNILLKEARHSIVGIWDTDVLIPENQLLEAVACIQEGCVLCFPYDGDFRFLNEEESCRIRENVHSLDRKQGTRLMGRPSVGGAFLVNKEKYLKAGGENEGFYGWGPEDAERVKRLEILELPISKIKGSLYHLYHGRTMEWRTNVEHKMQHNRKVFLHTCQMSKEELETALRERKGIWSYLNKIVKPLEN